MKWRFSMSADLPTLAEWNHRLIRDEGHRNPMTVSELGERMVGWLVREYKAVIFIVCEVEIGYALYRIDSDGIYLRQLFVVSEFRKKGHGRAAFGILRDQIWPPDSRLTVDVLTKNTAAVAFWRAVGYEDYCLTLEILPKTQAPNQALEPTIPGVTPCAPSRTSRAT